LTKRKAICFSRTTVLPEVLSKHDGEIMSCSHPYINITISVPTNARIYH